MGDKNTNEYQSKCMSKLITQTKFKLDTGSDISIIHTCIWKKIGRPKLNENSKFARDVSGK